MVRLKITTVTFPTVVVLVFCVHNYVGAYIVNNNPHHQRVTLDPQGIYQLEWMVDLEAKKVTFNVTVRTKGYVGFGLSDNGKMTGADIVVGGVLPNGRSYFSDRHAVGHQTPELDDSQDWTLLAASESDTSTMLTFSRSLDTCDPQDYPITENKIAVIWAYGERDDIRYHYRNRGIFQVYLLHENYVPQMFYDRSYPGQPIIVDDNHKDTRFWQLRSVIQLPVQATTYWCTLQKAPSLKQKHHAIGFDVRPLGPLSTRHLHHLVIFRCRAPPGRDAKSIFEPFLGHRGQHCLSIRLPQGPIPTEYCSEYYTAWGIGGRPYFLPAHVGQPFGESEDEYYVVQHHLDNPTLDTNVELDIAMDLFYTSKLRKNDGGMMFIRHESPGLPASLHLPPHSVDHQVLGFCSGACTQKMFAPDGVTIYGGLLHTHYTGIMVRHQHFRGNKELEWIDNDENYNNVFQQFRMFNREQKVLPGDLLAVRCSYDTARANRTVVGGFGTQEEMCLSVILYYNRIQNSPWQICMSEIRSPEMRRYFLAGVGNVTFSAPHGDFLVDPPHPLAGLTISQVSDNHVDWTEERREELQRFHLKHPQWGRCPRELYAGGPAEGGLTAGQNQIDEAEGVVTYPRKVRPYQPERSCSFKN